MPAPKPDPEKARLLFAKPCTFVKGAVDVEGLPDPHLPEIAFAGRSNVGKSSLLNALMNRKTLARVSVTPGRTREINFFNLSDRMMFVDLPGYGYAKMPKDTVQGWTDLIRQYLAGRQNLRRVCLLIDSRHGIKKNDLEIMKLLDDTAVIYQVVLTKTDKLKKGELETVMAATMAEIARHGAAYPEIITSSVVDRHGIEELRLALAGLVTS